MVHGPLNIPYPHFLRDRPGGIGTPKGSFSGSIGIMTWATQVHQSRLDFGPLAETLDRSGLGPVVRAVGSLFSGANSFPARVDRLTGEEEGQGVLRMPAAGGTVVPLTPGELIKLWAERPTHVTGIDLSNFALNGFGFLRRFTGVERLYLEGSNVSQSDLKGVGELRTPRVLFIDRTPVVSLAPLAQLNLELLSAENTAIDSLAALAGQKQLRKLFVSDSKVTDLAPLAGKETLQTLAVARTGVTDFTPLKGCVSLVNLFVSEDMLAQPSLKELQAALPELRVQVV